MTIFNNDILNESSDWAVEQMYDMSPFMCPVCRQTSCITHKETKATYRTVYDLFYMYKEACNRFDVLERIYKVNKYDRMVEINKNRKQFIQFVRDNCPDKVLYKHNYYYNYIWFKEEFLDNIGKHYFDFTTYEYI